jgi:transcriptional regulator with XRE-family HTH domain
MAKSANSGTTVARTEQFAANSVGSGLRRLRKDSQLTLVEVAKEVDISPSFLSLVENGKSDITIGRLTRLVQFYGASIGDLIPHAEPADLDIVRQETRGRLHSSSEGLDIYLLSSAAARTMMPMLLEFEPDAGRAEPGQHAGEEFVFVLEGELLLQVGTEEPQKLCAGDSASYLGDRPHLFRNASDSKPLRLLCVDSSRVL